RRRVAPRQRATAQHPWRQTEGPREPCYTHRAPVGRGQLGHEAVEAHLRVQTHLVVGMKTSAGHVSLGQHFDPPGRWVGVEHPFEMRYQLATMCQPSAEGVIVRVVQQRLLPEGPAQTFPLCLGARTDGEIPIAHTKSLVWD